MLRRGWITGILAVCILGVIDLAAQTEQQLANYLQQNPDADADGDGKLTREEARNHRRKDPSRGDNLSAVQEIPAVEIPLADAPLEVVHLKSPDGVILDFAWRRPASKGSLPAIVFFHGGGGYSDIDGLKRYLQNGAMQTRFLQKGYVTVQSTRRPYWPSRGKDQPTGFHDAVQDAVLVVERVKQIPGIDPEKIVLYGGSGGGILAIATAAKTKVAAVVAGEPATVILLDPRTGQSASPAAYSDLMEDPLALYNSDRKKEVLEWLQQVSAPVLILQGNQVGLYRTNFEILVPEMRRLGKDISFVEFPGKSHGFYWGNVKAGATLETVEKIMQDVDQFLQRHL